MANGNGGGDRAAAMAAREAAWRALADQALGRTTGTVFLESLTHTFASIMNAAITPAVTVNAANSFACVNIFLSPFCRDYAATDTPVALRI